MLMSSNIKLISTIYGTLPAVLNLVSACITCY